MLFVGVDIGGTFTDLLAYDTVSGRVESVKCLTTYDDLARGVLDCVRAAGIDPAEIAYLFHGTTIVINTVIQRTGSRTALITTEGFRDVLEIARANRPEPYNLLYRRADPLVERRFRYEVAERIGSRGQIMTPLDRAGLAEVVEQIRAEGFEAVAIAFFNAYANPEHERLAAAYVREALPDCFVTAATELSRELREYERTSTAVVNAYVGKMVRGYIEHRLEGSLREAGFRGRFFVMESSGGVMTAASAAERPALLMESGPVAGVIGSAHLGARMGERDVISFDMGGTTAKCCLVEAGRPAVTDLYFVGGYQRGFPVQAPMLDVAEVGAGGGSIAWLDETGSLRVGPRSAGSEPGPVAYGRGGTEPTVTDANIVLGRIDPDYFLGGAMRLDAAAAHAAVGRLAARLDRDMMEIAEGIVRIANFSAAGMLVANVRHDDVHSVLQRLDEALPAALEHHYRRLEAAGRAKIADEAPDAREIVLGRLADMRYGGQEHTVKVTLTGAATSAEIAARFEQEYDRLFGHTSKGVPIEIVSIRVTAEGRLAAPAIDRLGQTAHGTSAAPAGREVYFAAAGGFVPTPIHYRAALPPGARLDGPAVIQEYGSTTVLHPGDRLRVEANGVMMIEVGEG